MACSASMPQVVLFICKEKLLDYTTILVTIQQQVEREIKNSHPQRKKKSLVIQIHQEVHFTTEIVFLHPSTSKMENCLRNVPICALLL